jgi:hypothetical protein
MSVCFQSDRRPFPSASLNAMSEGNLNRRIVVSLAADNTLEQQLDQMGLPPLWSQEDSNPVIQVLLRDTSNSIEWYVIEGSRQPDDYRFYGFQVQGLPVRRHFVLSDLQRDRLDVDTSPRGKKWSEIRVLL